MSPAVAIVLNRLFQFNTPSNTETHATKKSNIPVDTLHKNRIRKSFFESVIDVIQDRRCHLFVFSCHLFVFSVILLARLIAQSLEKLVNVMAQKEPVALVDFVVKKPCIRSF